MKILYAVADAYPPYRVDVVELFGRQMVRRGHAVDWVMSRRTDGQADSELQWMGGKVHLPAGKGFVSRLLNDVRIIRLALQGRYDVIQVRDRFLVGIVCWIAARLSGARFVYWMSYPYGESKLDQARQGNARYPWLTYMKGLAILFLQYKVLFRLADHVFVQSEQMRSDVEKKGIPPQKMTAVPMGVRGEQVGRAQDARAPNAAKPLLVHLGIIMRLRESQLLVKVLGLVRQRFPQARLQFVGHGQEAADEAAVWDEARRSDLVDAVEVTGFLPMHQAWEHVRNADVCISAFPPIPVLLSTSPTKLVEYMALGKCVVANDHPEQSLVMRDSGIGLANAWGAEAFAEAICRILDDPEAARQNAAKGPDWVRSHRSYDVIADKVEQVYLQLLGRQGPREARQQVDATTL